MSSRPVALGLHIYSGAFTLGMARHFKIIGQWEEGPWAADTFELNFPKVPHPLTMEDWPVRDVRPQVMYANPPCAPWSAAGSRLGMADPRVQFSKNCMELALQLKPEVFVIESVCRAWSPNGGRVLYEEFAGKFQRLGYAVTILMTNAVLHGAPQWRERFHFIAHRGELTLPEPRMTHADVMTVRDAIEDLADSAVFADEAALPSVPNHVVVRSNIKSQRVINALRQGEGWGECYQRLVAKGLDVAKARFIAGRVRYDSPSSTLLDIGAMVHPVKNRMLTVREGARLCTYPDDFVFAVDEKKGLATASDVTQVVLPVMGDYLGGRFMLSLDSNAAEPGAFRVIDFRKLGRQFSSSKFGKTK